MDMHTEKKPVVLVIFQYANFNPIRQRLRE